MRKENQSDDEREPVKKLWDIIDARDERRSAFADDIDNKEDIELPDDIDVNDALTFPHPHSKQSKRRRAVDADLSGTTDEFIPADEQNESDFDYDDSTDEMLPTDYAGAYNEAMSTDVSDSDDEEVEDIIDNAGDITTTDIIYEDEIPEPLPGSFRGEDTEG